MDIIRIIPHIINKKKKKNENSKTNTIAIDFSTLRGLIILGGIVGCQFIIKRKVII